MTCFCIYVFLCFIHLSAQKSTPADQSYVAAVVEYQVQSDEPTNLQNYLQLIEDAANQNADIIVFPEMTLTRGQSVVVPIYGLLKEYPIPATHPELYDEIIVSISAAAKQRQIYVVINVQEMMDCRNGGSTGETCPKQKQYRFNTNVVFDRNGAVIDRYRKINLFGELSRTAALAPDLGVFTTDFGVTFGHFICFDLMFQVPSIQVVQKNNITDVIFPTMWFSEMPYLTAVEIQQAYAHTMNVNFLTAGANNVRVGSTGSGIFSGKAGALISLMTGVPTTRLLVAEVPKVPGQVDGTYPGPIYDNPADQDNLFLITDASLLSHVSRLLKTGLQDFSLEDKDVHCHFKVRLSQREGRMSYRYRAFAFSGVRTFDGVATGGVKACSVLACAGETIGTCGTRFSRFSPNSTSIFHELTIIAKVPTPVIDTEVNMKDTVYFPVSLDTSIMPLKPEDHTYYTETVIFNGMNNYTLNLKNVTAELYTFGIWGRTYTFDGKEASPPIEDIIEFIIEAVSSYSIGIGTSMIGIPFRR